MTRISVSFDVSEDIYRNVIQPHKESKKLSKLMAALVSAYDSDDYVFAKVEEGVVSEEESDNSELLSALAGLRSTLKSQEELNEEAGYLQSMGQRAFSGPRYMKVDKSVSETVSPPQDGGDTVGGQHSGVSVEDVEKLVAEAVEKALGGISTGSNRNDDIARKLDENSQMLGELLKVMQSQTTPTQGVTVSTPTPAITTTQGVGGVGTKKKVEEQPLVVATPVRNIRKAFDEIVTEDEELDTGSYDDDNAVVSVAGGAASVLGDAWDEEF